MFAEAWGDFVAPGVSRKVPLEPKRSHSEFLNLRSTILQKGIYKPDSGTTKVYGKVAPLLQIGVGFQGDLNAKENIIMNGMLLNIPKTEIEKKTRQPWLLGDPCTDILAWIHLKC